MDLQQRQDSKSAKHNLFYIFGSFCLLLFIIDYISLRVSISGHLRDVTVVHAPRPLMYTFFEPVEGGCCGMSEQAHEDLVKAWENAWQSYGWDTKVLSESDAKRHPDFDSFQEKLIEADVNEYDRRCFWRWLAMANLEDGGWISDYDNFPLTLTADIGIELGKLPGFKSWQLWVPSLLNADRESWNKIVKLMMDTISPDLDVKTISDMQLLLYLHNHLSEQEMGVSVWTNEVLPGFPYIRGGEGKGPKIDCSVAQSYLAAHLSHRDSHEAFEESHTYPRIEGMTESLHAEKRGDAAHIMLRDYREKCVE
ncbi:hypothetical protein HJC23_009047 [Cyclotella cryptica]|uniref:Uncharacterized protein n=1 Tax=Cyclotella cryptica TaxID=29204 RepID=A0ABD3QYK1_9STRA|eukprot:CCRYP_000658-RA/>CCRYP_000658-RA protein AED:0.11 eAED:0.11 QI:0/-1/0/1/-1/1/1/0/308